MTEEERGIAALLNDSFPLRRIFAAGQQAAETERRQRRSGGGGRADRAHGRQETIAGAKFLTRFSGEKTNCLVL